MMLDPTTSVSGDELPNDWDDAARRVLSKFYSGPELNTALGQLLHLVNHTGKFGEEVNRCREANEKVATAGKYHIQVILDQQVAAVDSMPHLQWKSIFGREYPLLLEPAVRLLTMGTQSADVERCCKVHKLIHTKMRNRLKSENVQKLVYFYVNLRLIKRMQGYMFDDEFDDFLTDVMKEVAEEVE